MSRNIELAKEIMKKVCTTLIDKIPKKYGLISAPQHKG